MAKKVQTQLLISPITRQRADSLAVVMGEPRAEILRRALEGGGLHKLELQQNENLNDLSRIGREIAGLKPGRFAFLEFAERVARDGFTLADLREMTEYPEPEQG